MIGNAVNNNGWLADFKHSAHLFSSIIVLLLLLSSFTYASGSDNVVKIIEAEGLTRMKERELIELIDFQAGDTLNMERLSAGIKRAFRKGLFHDIKAVSEHFEGGIKLKYVVKEIPLIKEITVSGNKIISGKKIKEAFIFKDGDGFIDELLDKAIDDLRSFYQKKGFPYAEASVVVDYDRMSTIVEVHINIKEGQPQRIEMINIPYHLRAYLRLSDGDIFDRDKADRDIKRLRDYFRKHNYINPVIGPYKYVNGELSIPVIPGPRLNVSFKGNTAISTRDLMKELPFIEEEEVTDELIDETADRIRRLYRTKGYRHAEVAAAVSLQEETFDLSFFIFEGKKMYFRKIGFSGNSISHDVLMSVVSVEEERPFNPELLKKSRDSLIIFYNALGYLNVDIADIKESVYDDGIGIDIEFAVNEGHQIKIRGVEISGNIMIGTDIVKSVLKLNDEVPYNVIDIGDARHRILSLYKRFGYLDAGIEVKSRINNDEAFLSFIITENIPSVAGKIIIRGNRKTRDWTIKRELTIEEGDTYSVEEVLRMKQKIYKLGLFSEVEIDILEPDSSESNEVHLVRDMLVTLKESRPGSVEVGIGYGDYEKFRGSLEIRYRNMGGQNRQIVLRAEKSSVDEKYILNYKEPWLFNRPGLPFNAFLKKEKGESVNFDTRELYYKFDKLSFVSEIEIKLSRNLKAGLAYEYSYTDTTEVAPGAIISKEDVGTLGISSVSPSLFYDLRDNPFDPTSGSINGIVLEFASKAYLSEVEFVKGTFQSTWFFPLKKGVVFAVSLKGGLAHAFGDSKELPLVERFFLGGRTTVRGYTNDTLGPKGDDDVPTGGNVFALLNNEFRVPVRKGLGIVVFLDGGNVWQLIKDIDMELKYTVGAGFRYKTPVGPLRIDYGYKLNREEGESSGELHFSFGHAF
jgi:outer membrane protein insertion porin family